MLFSEKGKLLKYVQAAEKSLRNLKDRNITAANVQNIYANVFP